MHRRAGRLSVASVHTLGQLVEQGMLRESWPWSPAICPSAALDPPLQSDPPSCAPTSYLTHARTLSAAALLWHLPLHAEAGCVIKEACMIGAGLL